jgi:hypothetical protein
MGLRVMMRKHASVAVVVKAGIDGGSQTLTLALSENYLMQALIEKESVPYVVVSNLSRRGGLLRTLSSHSGALRPSRDVPLP